MNIYCFKRYEFKYLLTHQQYERILKEIKNKLYSDQFGNSIIQSLYYDTDNYRLIRKSLEKPIYKEKLRIRSYGLVKDNDTVFIELKKKYNGIVFKRRLDTTYKESSNLLCGKKTDERQIYKEIRYFIDFYKDLKPKVLLIYNRQSYTDKNDLRITFDQNIRYRTTRLCLSQSLDGIPIFMDGKILMEIKTSTSIPLWFCEILSKEKIFKTSFSKYGEVYKNILINQNLEVKTVG